MLNKTSFKFGFTSQDDSIEDQQRKPYYFLTIQSFDFNVGASEKIVKQRTLAFIQGAFDTKEQASKSMDEAIVKDQKLCGKLYLWKFQFEANEQTQKKIEQQEYIQRKDFIIFFHPNEFFKIPKHSQLEKDNKVKWENVQKIVPKLVDGKKNTQVVESTKQATLTWDQAVGLDTKSLAQLELDKLPVQKQVQQKSKVYAQQNNSGQNNLQLQNSDGDLKQQLSLQLNDSKSDSNSLRQSNSDQIISSTTNNNKNVNQQSFYNNGGYNNSITNNSNINNLQGSSISSNSNQNNQNSNSDQKQFYQDPINSNLQDSNQKNLVTSGQKDPNTLQLDDNDEDDQFSKSSYSLHTPKSQQDNQLDNDQSNSNQGVNLTNYFKQHEEKKGSGPNPNSNNNDQEEINNLRIDKQKLEDTIYEKDREIKKLQETVQLLEEKLKKFQEKEDPFNENFGIPPNHYNPNQ